MENISPELLICLGADTAKFVELYEFFSPEEANLIPANALARFSTTSYTFDGQAYERKIVGRSDIKSQEGKQTNQTTIEMVNVDGWLSEFMTLYDVEGLWCQIRLVCPEYPTQSLVIFGGKVELPDDVGYQTGTITVVQDVYGGVGEIPQRTQGAQCPLKFKGKACRGNQPIASKTTTYQQATRCNKSFNQCLQYGNEVNYGGFRFVPISGTFSYTVEEVKRFLLFFKKKKRRTVSATFSSVSDAKEDTAIPLVFGTTQVEALPVMHADTGANLKFLSALCEGPIDGVFEVRVRDKQYQPVISNYAFAVGQYGSESQPASVQFPGAGKFSGTAWIEGSLLGSDPTDANDSAPTLTAIVRGQVIDLPNPADGFSFTSQGWSDCGPYIVRYLLKTFGNLKDWLSDDESFVVAGLKTFEPVIDDTGVEQSILPQQVQGGVDFKAFASASGFGAATVDRIALMMAQGKVITGGYGQLVEAYYRYINQQQPPGFISPVRKVRRRYTTNFEVDTKTELATLLEDMILPSFNGKLVASLAGKTRLKVDGPVPGGILQDAIITPGATSLNVDDITPFLFYRGQILVGAHTPTAEIARVNATRYSTAGNAITLTAVGASGIAATVSGATLSGGDAAQPATGTVTLSGTVAAGSTITITIDGTPVSFTCAAGDDLIALAGYMAAMINAHTVLRRFIRAEWNVSQGAVIRLVCKLGTIDLVNSLTSTHEVLKEILPVTAVYSGRNIEEKSFRWKPGSNLKAINRVEGAYRAAVNDWAETSIWRDAEAHQDKTGQVNKYDLNLSAVDNGHQAARLCKIKMGKVYVARQRFSLKTGRQAIRHEIDDLVVVDYVHGRKIFRNIPAKIEAITIDRRLQVQLDLRIYRSEIYDDTINELTPQILYPLDASTGTNISPTPPNPPPPNPPPDILPDYGYQGYLIA